MRVHWFAVTVFVGFADFEGGIWPLLGDFLGDLVYTGHGARSYRQLYKGLSGSKVYAFPSQMGRDGSDHVHLELPGDACDCLPPDKMITLFKLLDDYGLRYTVKRLDIAFDGLSFTPGDVYRAILDGKLNSFANRKSIQFIESPYEEKDDGTLGTSTVYVGSGQSLRMLRVYDKRGFTRAELQFRDERAHIVAVDLFTGQYDDWDRKGKSHLRQYVEFTEFPEWEAFIDGVERYSIRIPSARVVSLEKLTAWMKNQVACAFYVLQELGGGAYALDLAQIGERKLKKKTRSRYDVLLQMVAVDDIDCQLQRAVL